jgi:hypothetical protein
MLFASQVRERLMVAGVPSLERQQVLAGLGSSIRRLSADEATTRRAEIGANQLPAAAAGRCWPSSGRSSPT